MKLIIIYNDIYNNTDIIWHLIKYTLKVSLGSPETSISKMTQLWLKLQQQVYQMWMGHNEHEANLCSIVSSHIALSPWARILDFSYTAVKYSAHDSWKHFINWLLILWPQQGALRSALLTYISLHRGWMTYQLLKFPLFNREVVRLCLFFLTSFTAMAIIK